MRESDRISEIYPIDDLGCAFQLTTTAVLAPLTPLALREVTQHQINDKTPRPNGAKLSKSLAGLSLVASSRRPTTVGLNLLIRQNDSASIRNVLCLRS